MICEHLPALDIRKLNKVAIENLENSRFKYRTKKTPGNFGGSLPENAHGRRAACAGFA